MLLASAWTCSNTKDQRASVPLVTARTAGSHAWGGEVKSKREKEQFELLLPKIHESWPESSSHLPAPVPEPIFPNPAWTLCISYHMLCHPDHRPWNKYHFFHISRLTPYIKHHIFVWKKVEEKQGAWVRKQKTEAAWPYVGSTLRARGWEENVPRQLVGNDREKCRAVFWCFKVRPGLTVKPASGWPLQGLLTSADGGAEEAAAAVPRLRKGMVPRCSPAPCCSLSERLWLWQPKHFQLSSVKKPRPNARRDHFYT